MSIDEFGQFRRKGNSPNTNLENKPISDSSINLFYQSRTYFKDLFRPRSRREFIRLALFLLFWSLICAIVYVSSVVFMIVLLTMLPILCVPINMLIVDKLSISIDDYIEVEKLKAIIVLILVFVVYLMVWSGISFIVHQQKIEKKEEQERIAFSKKKYSEKYSETFIDSLPYYFSPKTTYTYRDIDDQTLSKSITRGVECIVVAEIGDFYKVLIDGSTFYVPSPSLLPLNDSIKTVLQKEIEKEKLLSHFKVSGSITTYTKKSNGTKMIRHGNWGEMYWGEADKNNNRDGEGSYSWAGRSGSYSDSTYIGNWDKGLMSGYGLMYYPSKYSKNHKHGIWKDNKLIEEYKPLSEKEVLKRMNESLNMKLQMIMADVKPDN